MPSNPTIGIDIGGTKIRAGLVAPNGKILCTDQRLTLTNKGKGAVLGQILGSIGSLMRKDVRTVGVGIAGSVDPVKGIYRQGPNFPKAFRNIPLSRIIREEFGVTAAVDNDVHCFALGEARFGAGKGTGTIVCLTLGTGIGGAIIANGQVMRGKGNMAGEIGHMTVETASRRRCSCGRFGHLEGIASGTAMAKAYERATKKRLKSFWDLETLVAKGDRRAIKVVDEAVDYLGAGIAGLLHIIDPEMVIIGGGTSKIRRIWQKIPSSVRKHLAYPHLIHTPVLHSKLGDDANVLGAAFMAQLSKK